jgi:hypothetical protein
MKKIAGNKNYRLKKKANPDLFNKAKQAFPDKSPEQALQEAKQIVEFLEEVKSTEYAWMSLEGEREMHTIGSSGTWTGDFNSLEIMYQSVMGF